MSVFDKNQWTVEQRRYFEYIHRCALLSKDQWISNGKPSHAIFLVGKFLELATSKVRILSGSLKRESDIETVGNGGKLPIYADTGLLDRVENFLTQDEGVELSIITERPIDLPPEAELAEHPLIKRVLSLKEQGRLKGRFALRQLSYPDAFVKSFGHHFAVMDQDAYRLETDTDNAKAVANFGREDKPKELNHFFDVLQKDSADTLILSP